jgi:hypothetical protein
LHNGGGYEGVERGQTKGRGTGQSFVWLPNKFRPLQISNSLEICLFLHMLNDFLWKNKMPGSTFTSKNQWQKNEFSEIFKNSEILC